MNYLFRLCCLTLVYGTSLCAAAPEMPRLVQEHGRYSLYVDGQPYFILGGQIHNSSAWPAVLPQVWAALEFIHANTVEAAVYWEQLESQPGQFDFTNVDAVVEQARQHKLHVVLLWFGTWKNARCHYVPDWIKSDTARYPRLIDASGRLTDSLSPFGAATLEADERAFAALLRHLKAIDGEQHTVLMVQVENESGSLDSVRDYSAAAQKLFSADVPAELIRGLNVRSGNWEQVFGSQAAERFQAYAVARYIDQVAAAGKREYPLPMYVNAWVRTPDDFEPTPSRSYPSGGAVDVMLDLWKAVTHSIDLIGPDIYLSGDTTYRRIISAYHRSDNALFVPENANQAIFARYPFSVLGEGGIGFAVWGLDHVNDRTEIEQPTASSYPELVPFERTFRVLASMDREIARLTFAGELRTAMEGEDVSTHLMDFGKWTAIASFGRHDGGMRSTSNQPTGELLVARIAPDEFLVTGFDARIEFNLAHPGLKERWQILKVEEGTYEDGHWKVRRLLNGDECDFGVDFGDAGRIIHMKLGTY
jgi:hypothetical protein